MSEFEKVFADHKYQRTAELRKLIRELGSSVAIEIAFEEARNSDADARKKLERTKADLDECTKLLKESTNE